MKGILYMVEAVLAGIILIAFLAALKAVYLDPNPQHEYGVRAHQILRDLDERGILRPYAEDNNYAGLNNLISSTYLEHGIRICDSSWSCAGTVPNATDVWAGTYIIAGNDSFSPRTVKLYLWRSS
jgi:hypothetical protein